MNEHHKKINQLKKDWRQLEQLSDESQLSNLELEEQLSFIKQKKHKKLGQEFIVFLLVAICLVSVIAILMNQAFLIYIIFQFAAIIIGPIAWLLLRKKNREVLHHGRD